MLGLRGKVNKAIEEWRKRHTILLMSPDPETRASAELTDAISRKLRPLSKEPRAVRVAAEKMKAVRAARRLRHNGCAVQFLS